MQGQLQQCTCLDLWGFYVYLSSSAEVMTHRWPSASRPRPFETLLCKPVEVIERKDRTERGSAIWNESRRRNAERDWYRKKDRRGEKEQYWSRPGCWRAQLMIRDGKINPGRNEKDWFGSETIKKKWRQELVWEGRRKKDDRTRDTRSCNHSAALDFIIKFSNHSVFNWLDPLELLVFKSPSMLLGRTQF